MLDSNFAEASLARWRITHFAPVAISSGQVTDVCRHCGESHSDHEVNGNSLPCPSKMGDLEQRHIDRARELIAPLYDEEEEARELDGKERG